MRVKLRVMQGAQAGREVIIPVSEFLIGRGEECHLRPRSDAISRQHCAIVVSEKQVVVRDLGSKNGSYVNGQRVEGEQVVQAGDQFQVGPLEFEIVIEHVLGGAKRPAARDVKEVAARTAASSNEDLDIARWLEDEDDTDVSHAVATPETRQFRIDDTSNLALETNVDGKPTRMASNRRTRKGDDDEARRLAEDEQRRRRRRRGKRRHPAAGRRANQASCRHAMTSSKDSREAAADMLKRFFNRG